MPSPQDPIAIGTRIGPYEIVGAIGSGGMGRVFLATDHSLGDRQVVIKTIRTLPGVDPVELEARFVREARSLARLHHEHVIGVFAAGVHAGQPYLVMEYFPGRDLAAYAEEGALLADHERDVRVVRAIAQVACGIEHAHSKGVVHRDLKPSNILMRKEDDRAVILDFGIAHATGEAELTRGPQLPGTLAFEAPEQLDVNRKRRDELIDVWALGVLLYRLLTGRHPFHGDDAQSIAHQILNVDPPRPREIRPTLPRALDEITVECLQKNPAARPGSAAEVAGRLEQWLARAGSAEDPNEDETASEPAVALVARAPRRRRFAAAGAVSALALVLLAAVIALAPIEDRLADAQRLLGFGATPARSHAPRIAGELVEVEAGPFLLGCPPDAGVDCGDPLEPFREAKLAAFEIDRTPVTVADYTRCVRADRCSANGLRMPFFLGEEQPEVAEYCNWGVEGRTQHPINCVSFAQAEEFCAWAGKRLPTGHEREKAARGTDGRLYPWGNDGFDGATPRANIADESARGKVAARKIKTGYSDGYAGTSPVGAFPEGASPYGALDMVGNVWEWVADQHEDRREVRGSSWGSEPAASNAIHRRLVGVHHRSPNGGFRCAYSEDPDGEDSRENPLQAQGARSTETGG